MNIDETLNSFKESYLSAISKQNPDKQLAIEEAENLINTLRELTLQEVSSPYKFGTYHKAIRSPFDYYRFGNDFFRPLIKMEESKVLGKEILNEISLRIGRKENVILLSNHQTEPDPQIISILIEEEYPELAERMIFVAGHRVVTDPVAIPFSKGRNLLCIHSKRYIEHPPEQREEKTLHNRKTLERMKELLQEGGKCIYVAPSGGRDRAQDDKIPRPAPFDGPSLELFYLIAKAAAQNGSKTHFYPFAMKTYEMLPPPDTINKELGETRLANCVPVGISFGKEVIKDQFDPALSKIEKREAWADYVWKAVIQEYNKL